MNGTLISSVDFLHKLQTFQKGSIDTDSLLDAGRLSVTVPRDSGPEAARSKFVIITPTG